MTKAEILAALNPEQARAAATLEGPVLVLAGAGTGKTRVITYRIAYMLASGIAPERILGMTFTNKAASEMKERLAALCSAEAATKVTLGTFHSFCCRVLRREIGALGYLPGFTIIDDSDQKALIKQAAASCGYPKEDAPVAEAQSFISRAKNALEFPADARRTAAGKDADYVQIYAAYQKLLELQNVLDFDDLLLFTHAIFSRFPEVLARYRERYEYLLVDEYQDTNIVQFELVKMLAGERQNLCVVGDDDQSIYGWRGADAGNILKFTEHFPRAADQEIKLEQNYRSMNNILRAANAVIAGGYARKEKSLWSRYGDGELINVYEADDAEREAEFIVDYMQQQMELHREYTLKDCAILYRSNYLSRQLEQTLRSREVPYVLVGGQEFYERREVKDAVAYLRLLVNPREDQSLLRILATPPRGLGDKAVAKLKELRMNRRMPMVTALNFSEFQSAVGGKGATAARELATAMAHFRLEFETPGNLSAKAREYFRAVGYMDSFQRMYKDIEDAEKRLENVEEFLNAIAIFEGRQSEPPTLLDYMEKFALLEENDRSDDQTPDGNGVILSTIHAAKGLEFPMVFVVGMEKNIFPNERALAELAEDEELRLFYVAITRAKHQLTLTSAKKRMRYGMWERQYPSKFLARLPETLLHRGGYEDFITKLSLDDVNAGFAEIFKALR